MSTSRSGVMVALRDSVVRREPEASRPRAAHPPTDASFRGFESEAAASDGRAGEPAAPAQSVGNAPAGRPDAALAAELLELAQARTTSDAQRIAASVRVKLGGPEAPSYLKLVDALVQRAREYERLGRLAGSDELTGIANRRAFNDALRRELARTSRDGRPVALLLLDLDGLKAINDSAGHAAGDRALRLLARCASEAVRHGDIVARIGGDEFAVLLPNTGASMASAVVQRIRDRLAVGCAAEPDLKVGVSIGSAVADESTTRMDLLRAADAELYRDKENRRLSRSPSHSFVRVR